MKTTIEQSLELDRQIAAGELTEAQGIAELIRIGVPSSLARKRVGILTGKRKELEIPATATRDGEPPDVASAEAEKSIPPGHASD